MRPISIYRIICILLLLSLITAGLCLIHISKVSSDRELSYKNLALTYADSVQNYKVRDSLNAAYTSGIESTLAWYKQARADDADIISKLKKDKLESIVGAKVATKYLIRTSVRDSIVYRDSILYNDTIIYKDTIKAINYNSYWASVTGFVSKDSAQLNIQSRDELLITQSVKRKKFLFFKLNPRWFGYKEKQLNVVSKNPNCEIQSVEFIQVK